MKRLIALFVIGMTVMAGTAYAGFVVASQAPVAGDATYACVSTAGAVRPSTIRVNVVPVSCPKGSDVVRTLAVIPPVPAPLTPPIGAVSVPMKTSGCAGYLPEVCAAIEWGGIENGAFSRFPMECNIYGVIPYQNTRRPATSVWLRYETGEWIDTVIDLDNLRGTYQVPGHYVTEIKVTCLGDS